MVNITGVEVSTTSDAPGFEIHCNVLSDGHVNSDGFVMVCEAESEEERAAWINAICMVLVAKPELAPQDVEKSLAAGAAGAAGTP